MNTGIQHMNTGNWIQLGALLVALVSLIWQQSRVLAEEQRKEKRIETKLRIFYALKERDRNEAEIISEIKHGQPVEETNEVEIRKCLYEMLTDMTIYYQADFTYRVHWRSPKTKDSPN